MGAWGTGREEAPLLTERIRRRGGEALRTEHVLQLRATPAPSLGRPPTEQQLLQRFCSSAASVRISSPISTWGAPLDRRLRRRRWHARAQRTARPLRRPADPRALLCSISRIHLRALTRGRTHAGAMAPGVRRASPVCYRWVRLPVRAAALGYGAEASPRPRIGLF